VTVIQLTSFCCQSSCSGLLCYKIDHLNLGLIKSDHFFKQKIRSKLRMCTRMKHMLCTPATFQIRQMDRFSSRHTNEMVCPPGISSATSRRVRASSLSADNRLALNGRPPISAKLKRPELSQKDASGKHLKSWIILNIHGEQFAPPNARDSPGYGLIRYTEK